jgi:hypothetical protein
MSEKREGGREEERGRERERERLLLYFGCFYSAAGFSKKAFLF